MYLRVHSDGLAELTPSRWADLLLRSKEEGQGHIKFTYLVSNSICLLCLHLCW